MGTAPSTSSPPPTIDWDAIPESIRKEMNISREGFEEIQRGMAARELETPAVGTLAPEFALRRIGSDGVLTDDVFRLSDLRGRPVALVFGSYTWPPFRIQAGRLNEIYDEYQDRVEFVCVYIQEAHPTDGWQVLMNVRDEILVAQAKTLQDRADAASACFLGLQFRMPMVLDKLSNEVDAAYSALPERLYVLDAAGTIAWRSGPGPFGFDVDGWKQAIAAQAAQG